MEESNNKKHFTNSKWIVWYHNPSDKNWNLSSYKDIIEISCLEDFCVLKNSWDKCLPKVDEGMFFIMRQNKDGKNIYPQWEDKHNRSGGYWSYKVEKTKCNEAWFKLFMYCIAEQICTNEKLVNTINGVSISPKKSFCILKIWNSDSSLNSCDLLSNIKYLNKSETLYSNHEFNIKKDHNKNNRNYRKKKQYTFDDEGFQTVNKNKKNRFRY